MKQVFFNPIILPLVATVGIVYIFLLSFWLNNKFNKHDLRWLVAFLFLFTGLNVTVFPFTHIYPEALTAPQKTLGSSILQLSIYAWIVLILRTWFKDFSKTSLILGKNPFLFGFLILSLLSACWSETPDLTLRYSLVVVFTSLFSIHIAREYSFQDLSDMLRRLTVVVAVASLGLAAIVPSLALNEKGLSGIMQFPIKLGTFMALGVALWLAYALENRKGRWKALGIVGFLSLMIPLTNSSQAIFAYFFMVALVILWHIVKVSGIKYFPILAVLYLSMAILSSFVLQTLLPIVLNSVGKDLTLTGRTDFWPQLIDRLEKHNLWLGYGMNGFWQPWRGEFDPAKGILTVYGFVPPHAHNGFLDLALNLGLIGLILFTVSFLIALSQAFQYYFRNKSAASSLPLIILIYVVFANISETQLLGSTYIWILYIIVLARLSIEPRSSLPKRPPKQLPSIAQPSYSPLM
jgi:exopolysaccharide production protein ExoQ